GPRAVIRNGRVTRGEAREQRRARPTVMTLRGLAHAIGGSALEPDRLAEGASHALPVESRGESNENAGCRRYRDADATGDFALGDPCAKHDHATVSAPARPSRP